MRLTAIEQGGEEAPEVGVDRLERGEQALAAFAVEAADRAAQAMDRLGQFLAFGAAAGLHLLQFLQFQRRDEIDRANPLAIGREAVMVGLFGLGEADVGAGKAQLFGQERGWAFETFARQPVGFDPPFIRGFGAGRGGGARFAGSGE